MEYTIYRKSVYRGGAYNSSISTGQPMSSSKLTISGLVSLPNYIYNGNTHY